MAFYIKVPKDLSNVKSKILFNLTKRQLLLFTAAALIGVPSYFLVKSAAGTSLAAMCMVLIMIPVFLFAMYEKDGEHLEAVLWHFIKAVFLRPKIRPYLTEDLRCEAQRNEGQKGGDENCRSSIHKKIVKRGSGRDLPVREKKTEEG
ncbi:MAG: PrgI family protein [Lachnospiraceae bacterium]|nr:PrgI family protein [Lachnospiraceae bacterium]